MQGQTRTERELLDARAMVGDLVPVGSVFAFLAEHRHELFPDSFIVDLFPSRMGRPSLPADLVGSVLVLKELFDLSDAQTAEALRFDIRWKVACGRSLTQTSFDPSTLVYWRRRVAASQRPDRVFDAVSEVIAETGILTGRRKRCLGSTVVDDAVATQDTVTQLTAAIRPGGAGGARRGRGDRPGLHAGLHTAGEAVDRLGRPGSEAEPGVGPGQRRPIRAGRAVWPGRAGARGQGGGCVGALGAGGLWGSISRTPV
jgi:hypothetical protein